MISYKLKGTFTWPLTIKNWQHIFLCDHIQRDNKLSATRCNRHSSVKKGLVNFPQYGTRLAEEEQKKTLEPLADGSLRRYITRQ